MSQSDRSASFFWGGLLIFLGALLILHNHEYLDFWRVLHEYWPLALVFLGLILVYNSLKLSKPAPGGHTQSPFANLPQEVLASNSFGDVRLNLNQLPFRSGRASTLFGSIKVEADRIILPAGQHSLHFTTTFGDIQIYLTRELPIKIHARGVVGDIRIFAEKRDGFQPALTFQSDSYNSSDAKLDIYCEFTFGNVRIF